jgi:hypothetical protein
MFLLVGGVGYAQSFRDNNNMRLGTISSDGTIRDNNNMRIGTTSGINAKYAAVLFFFDLL